LWEVSKEEVSIMNDVCEVSKEGVSS
jgi:hypothetical protein